MLRLAGRLKESDDGLLRCSPWRRQSAAYLLSLAQQTLLSKLHRKGETFLFTSHAPAMLEPQDELPQEEDLSFHSNEHSLCRCRVLQAHSQDIKNLIPYMPSGGACNGLRSLATALIVILLVQAFLTSYYFNFLCMLPYAMPNCTSLWYI